MVVAAGRSQTTFSAGLEMCRVDGSVLVMPGNKQRSSLHPGGGGHQARKLSSWRPDGKKRSVGLFELAGIEVVLE